MYDIHELNTKLLAELREIAKRLNVKRVESFRKQDLIYKILDMQAIVASESKTAKRKESPDLDKSAMNEPKKRRGRPPKAEKTAKTEANQERAATDSSVNKRDSRDKKPRD